MNLHRNLWLPMALSAFLLPAATVSRIDLTTG
jgi:hypothetical protein